MHENTALVDDETGVARDETFVFEGVYAPGTVDADGNDISGQANTIPPTKDISWYALGPGSDLLDHLNNLLKMEAGKIKTTFLEL